MGRKNRNPHPRRFSLRDRYDLDYVNLPEYPMYLHIIVGAHKTIYVNLDADFGADGVHTVRRKNDPILRMIAKRLENGVSA